MGQYIQAGVTKVDLTAPSMITVSGAPITSRGTIALDLAAQSSGTILAGPATGSAAAPTFRALAATDIPNLDAAILTSGTLSLSRLSGITTSQLSATAGITSGQITSVDAATVSTGTLPLGRLAGITTTQLSATAGITSGQIASVAASTITGTLGQAHGGTGLDTSLVQDGQLLIGRTSDHTWGLSTLAAGTGIVITNAGHIIEIAASGGTGTVTSVGMSVPSFLSVSGSPITTSGTLALSLANESANWVLAGPTTGGSTTPTFRALVAADIPNLDASKITTSQLALARGGTGLDSSAVTDGQLLIGQTTDHTLGLATLTAGTGITITNAGHAITIAAPLGAITQAATDGGLLSAYTHYV